MYVFLVNASFNVRRVVYGVILLFWLEHYLEQDTHLKRQNQRNCGRLVMNEKTAEF